jgi:hypothetical protein
MVRGRSTGRDRFVIACVWAAMVVLLLVAAGCSNKPSGQTTASAGTAKSALAVAKSALSTMAPDAKLLIVQTAEPVTTSTPVWAYLFGSPKTDKTYVVYVNKGRAMGAAEYGTAGLGKAEWGAVPGDDQWKVDSDAAYQKATAAAPVKKPSAYSMGFLTYIPKSQVASATTRPFVWYVSLQGGTATATVEVDAKSGAATVKK